MATLGMKKKPQSHFKITPLLLKRTFIVLPLLLLFLIYHLGFSHRFFKITDVQIYGVNHLAHDQLQDIVAPFVQNGFFNIDLAELKDRILQLAWTENVAIKRTWPNKLKIMLTEKKPIANWNDKSLLSDKGEIFSPLSDHYPLTLPQLVGPVSYTHLTLPTKRIV